MAKSEKGQNLMIIGNAFISFKLIFHAVTGLRQKSLHKALFSLSRFSSPVHPVLTNRGKPGQTVANRGRTVAAPWTTGANRGKPACIAGRFQMFNRTGANRDKCQKP